MEDPRYLKRARGAMPYDVLVNSFNIIDETLDLGKLESNNYWNNIVNLTKLERLCELLTVSAAKKEPFHVGDWYSEWVLGDPTRLKQIFMNWLAMLQVYRKGLYISSS